MTQEKWSLIAAGFIILLLVWGYLLFAPPKWLKGRENAAIYMSGIIYLVYFVFILEGL